MAGERLLQLENITKVFPGVRALDNISINLNKGEVLALVGENGAGKSTLIKIISGAYQQTEGTISYGGRDVGRLIPKESLALGISVIYQELSYLPRMTIAENILLGRQPKKGGFIDYKTLNKKSRELQEVVGLQHHKPTTKVSALSTAEKQLLEIARAYSRDLNILILDEPTSALNEEETIKLFGLVRKLREEGKSVIYISHKLDEIFEIADRVQIMRDGKTVHEGKVTEISKDEIVRYMVGRKIEDMYPIGNRKIGEKVLEVRDLSGDFIKDISLSVKRGEIVGLYGLMGSGCPEVLETIFGYRAFTNGEVLVEGKAADIKSPANAIKSGLAYVPSERKTEGILISQSVKHNITAVTLPRYKKGPLLDLKREAKAAEEWVEKVGVKTPSIKAIANNLSGGNQQKVILAKWMDNDPSVFLLNEPTKGIDVGSKVEIYRHMENMCNNGCGVLLVTVELPELMAVCDRVYVMFEGRITASIDKQDMNQETIVRRAIGE